MSEFPEFDPTSEKHFHLISIKAVDPGCTLELQIEEDDGTVTRLTTTEDEVADDKQFEEAVLTAFRRTWTRAASRAYGEGGAR